MIVRIQIVYIAKSKGGNWSSRKIESSDKQTDRGGTAGERQQGERIAGLLTPCPEHHSSPARKAK